MLQKNEIILVQVLRAVGVLWIKIGQVIKFMYSEKATKFCEISTLILTDTTWDKSKVEVLQNFVGFSEYINFKICLS